MNPSQPQTKIVGDPKLTQPERLEHSVEIACALLGLVSEGLKFPLVAEKLKPVIESFGGINVVQAKLLGFSPESGPKAQKIISFAKQVTPILKELWKRNLLVVPEGEITRITTNADGSAVILALGSQAWSGIKFFRLPDGELITIKGKTITDSGAAVFSPKGDAPQDLVHHPRI